MTAAKAGSTDHWTLADWENRLCRNSAEAVFTNDELGNVPDSVRRYLRTAIQLGTPLATSVRLKMRGRIRIGRWLRFTARQVLNPHLGTIWAARAAGVIAGSDRYLEGAGAMNWKLAGLVTVARADGPDVSRSTAGRAGAEAIWVPTALLPRFGVTWSATDENHITAHYQLGTTPVEVHLSLDSLGQIRSLVFDRWGDPEKTGTWGWHRFGGEITAYRSFAGLSIPGSGRLGWHFGTDRWPSGEFFRYEITSLIAAR